MGSAGWAFKGHRVRKQEADEERVNRRRDPDRGYIGKNAVKILRRVSAGKVEVEFVSSGDREVVSESSILSYPTDSR